MSIGSWAAAGLMLAALASSSVAGAAEQTTAISTYSVEPVPPPPLPAPDPERLAVAERLVDRIWPIGTYRRMMETTMQSTIGVLAGVGEAAGDAGYGDDKTARRAQHEARTGRPLPGSDSTAATGGSAADPQAAMAEMNAVLAPIFDRIEPPLRAAIARIYARRYDLSQLAELEAFFSTPTGAAYAADSLTLMNDPEMITAMQGSMGDMMGALMGVGASSEAEADAAIAAAVAASTNVGVKVE
jgi:Uncharacterized protein conserved in bacteria (DUF2059)